MNVHVLRMARRRRLELVRQWALACAISFAVCFGIGKAKAQDTTGNVVTTCGVVPLQYAPGANRPVTVDINGNLCSSGSVAPPGSGNAGYPTAATPVTAVFSGADTASQTVTLPAAAGQFTYLCGWSVDSGGVTTAADVTITVTGGANTLSYLLSLPAVATTVDAAKTAVYGPCLRGSAVNTAMNVVVPGGAGNTATTINAWGFQQ